MNQPLEVLPIRDCCKRCSYLHDPEKCSCGGDGCRKDCETCYSLKGRIPCHGCQNEPIIDENGF